MRELRCVSGGEGSGPRGGGAFENVTFEVVTVLSSGVTFKSLTHELNEIVAKATTVKIIIDLYFFIVICCFKS